MDRDTIIDGLRMTMDLCVFDPSTGEERDPDELNDLDRTTYDACKGALEILERLDTDTDTISRAKAIEALSELATFTDECSEHTWMYTDDVYGAIEQLPPAQPEKRTEERTETHACDSISRQAAIEALRAMQTYKLFAGDDMLLIDQAGAQTELMMLPPVQPRREERKIGEWIYDWGDWDFETCKCSECGNHTTTPIGERYSFCPNCGADMREVAE